MRETKESIELSFVRYGRSIKFLNVHISYGSNFLDIICLKIYTFMFLRTFDVLYEVQKKLWDASKSRYEIFF